MYKIIVLFIFLNTSGLIASYGERVAPDLTEILKSGVSQYEADEICRQNGMRLPTARELALVSQSMGSRGILNISEDKGYSRVKGSDSEGNPDHFYFSYDGYVRPEGELGNKWFWSSSIHPDYNDEAYVLYGCDGDVESSIRYNSYEEYSVRCVR